MSSGAQARTSDVGTTTPTRRAESRHGPVAQLLISWSPLSLIVVAYGVAGWISAPLGMGDGADTNRVGAHLHVLAPAMLDERLFGAVPSVWLQARALRPDPQWYDAVAALVYVTHFVAIPLVTALAWFRMRRRFARWVTAVLTMSVLGVTGYVVYPAAPPWLAAQRGDIGPVERVSHTGWSWLNLDWAGRLTEAGQEGSNPIAAMPSLHAGAAMLVVLFLWPVVSRWVRVVLSVYVVTMAVVLVYTGEHYVVDVVAGWALAAVAVVVSSAGRLVGPRAQTVGMRGTP